MMEFLLSKIWMVICGLVVVVVLMTAFDGLDDHTHAQAAEDCAGRISELLARMECLPDGTECAQPIVDILPSTDLSVQVANGSLWVRWDGGERAVRAPSNLILVEGDRAVDRLICSARDTLVLTSVKMGDRSMVRVQLEKVDTSSLTTSTNLLHSDSVL